MSGWTTLTLVPNESTTVEELHEAIDSDLAGSSDGHATARDDRVEVLLWGFDAPATGLMSDTSHLWSHAARIDANDTADAGDGWLFEDIGDDYAETYSAHGAESARAYDVKAELESHFPTRVYNRG